MAHYDMLVIGSGPAGQKAAIQAAKVGKKVGIIERKAVVGGSCINTGTIPSKSLREAVLFLSGFRQRNLYGASYRPTVSPLLTPAASRNVSLLQSLPTSIPYRQGNVRRRKDDPCVGTAARRNVERLSRFPRRLQSDGGSSGRVRRALSTGSGD